MDFSSLRVGEVLQRDVLGNFVVTRGKYGFVVTPGASSQEHFRELLKELRSKERE